MAAPLSYLCEVKEAFSGDDLMAMVDLGVENLWKKQRIRLYGVDTPNAINAQSDTEAGQIRTLVRNMVLRRKAWVTIISKNTSSWVVVLEIETPDGVINVNDFLIARGYTFPSEDTKKVEVTQ